MPGSAVRLVRTIAFNAAFLFPALAQASDFTVHNGETVGQQSLTDTGDTGTVDQGGTIYTSGDFTSGVNATGSENTVLNYGTVDTNGASSFGINATNDHATIVNESTGFMTGSGDTWTAIFSTGNNADLENRGTINGSGDFSLGMYSFGDNATIVNSGSITTSGFQSGGISSSGQYGNINNTGTISVAGVYANGIVAAGDNLLAVNSGSIAVSGLQSIGVNIFGASPEFTNVRTITAAGYLSTGIFSNSDNAVIVNRGDIIGWGDGSEGIYVNSGDGVVVTNSGRVITHGYDTWSIDMEGTNSTLNLLAGTVLQGGIYYLNADSATLNVGTGLNTALTFNSGSSLLALTLNTNGQPYAIDDKILAVVDPTGLAATNDFAFDFARSITDTVEARMGSADDGLTTGALPGQTVAHRDYWTAGLGFYDRYSARNSLDGFGYGAGGMMVGADRALSADSAAGLFGGVGAGTIGTDAGSTNINAIGAFAGGYWSRDDGKAFAHLSVLGGGLDNTSGRTVANNTVNGGLETASAEYGSFYVSPALTLGLHQHLGDMIVSPSLGLRYVGVYRNGYTRPARLPT